MIQIKIFTVNPLQQNTYLLFDEDKNAAIIDPGMYFEHEQNDIVNYLTDNGLQLKYIWQTHGHLDHIFSTKFMAEKYNLLPTIHAEDEPLIKFGEMAGSGWGLPFTTYSGTFNYLQHGDTVSLGKHALQVLHTPGHSPGSISFYSAAQNFVISGDVLFKNGYGRTDLPMCNHAHLVNSIKNQLFTLPSTTVVYSGHGEATTIANEQEYLQAIGFFE